jgi:hypothetical protein
MLEDGSLLWATQEGSSKPFVSKFFHIEDPQCNCNTSYAKFLGVMPDDIGIEALYTDALGRIYVMDTGQQHSSSVGNRLLRFTGDVVIGDFTYEVVNGPPHSVPDIDGLGPGINKTNGWVVDTPGFAIDSYDLYSVDYETGAFSFIGATDGPYTIHAINGSYFSDGKSRLYTLTGIPQVGETSSTLYEINPDTGVTLRNLGSGPSGMGLTGSLAPGPGDFPDENRPPVANVGPNQTVNEGDVVQLNGTGSKGSGAQDYWDSFLFGADSFITSAPSDTILATFDYYGTVYPALVATDYGNGRAVYAEGSTFSQLANLADPGNVHHQLFVNSVKWSTKGKDPATCNILVVWGHRELLTYWGSVPSVEGSNVTRALEDEGYNVSTSHDVPGSLVDYDAVIIPGIGWSWGGWVNPNLWSGPGGTNTAHKPTTTEVTTLLSFIQNGGGLVASVEYEYGADWLQDVGNPMGVYFSAITWETPYTAYRIVEHPIFLKWDGEPTEIISYEWDFESDGIYDYQETSTFAPDGTFDGKTTHTYGDDGRYTVTLRITDDVGLKNTDTCNVTVSNVAPAIDFSKDITEEWVARYNGLENLDDVLSGLAIDSSGNIYVTGKSYEYCTLNDYATIKYDSMGNELWVARYNGSGNLAKDVATAIAVDDTSGNVYVTGESLKEYATVAYDSSGKELWVAKYSGNVFHPDNKPYAIAIDISGVIYVTGTSWGIGTYYDFATIAYNPFGNELWVARYDDSRNWAMDVATAIAVDDSSGNIYVTGSSGLAFGDGSEDYVTVAYDSSGNELWVSKYNGPGNHNDAAFAICVASSGIIYVTGLSTGIGTLYDYTTVAYDSSGNELWVARYNGPINDHDIACSIALDLSGNIYITGSSFGNGTEMDYATVAYDSLGNELWVARYDGPKNDCDEAQSIALDSYGNVYVTGYSFGNGTERDYATIAYDSSGHELWVKRYNGPGNHLDGARAIALDSSGNIYVAGSGYGNGTDLDYATIKYSSPTSFDCNEGSSVTFTMNATDLGSDDLTFIWKWGDGTPDTVTTYYNDNTGPEPVYDPTINEVKSPWGTYPFNATDTVSHIYGDNGEYTVTLIVKDDDGGVTTYPIKVKVNNVEPTIEPFGPFTIDEGSSINISGIASDPGSDDLIFTWIFEYGPTITNVYYNDGVGPDPYPSSSGIFPFSATDTTSHTYGDDGIFSVTLTVTDDDGGSTTVMTNVTVNNVLSTVIIESVTMDIEIGLRVAGRKYNNVSMTLYEEGKPISNVSIERLPGSPNEQMAWISVSINFSKSYNATVTYTPEDPPNVGGNPVWIYIKSKDGSINKIHHTFNVQQSKKRDSEHWNHVEPWEVDLNDYFIGLPFEITSHITDPGSDDETLTFTYGSQVVTITYLNNPPNPDPYPSPEVKPMDILDVTTLTYEGVGTITLVVKDDDNIRLGVGEGTDSINIT